MKFIRGINVGRVEIGQQKTVERKDDDRYGTAVELGVSDRGNEKAHRDSEPGQLL